ncbi:YdcH family protein [Aliagarivorans marinus]|uniref:YdcH family protein n=1 Tax=Aliagarivorans marinus TaxID=561965 RepID=UPI0003F73EB2|nr:YdcH family protein [Aliagarivorans marinus]
MIEHHALQDDFPNLAPVVEQLVSNDPLFRENNTQYLRLDDEIYKLEIANVPSTDEHFTQLKLQRAHLKDWLYQRAIAAQ